VIHNLPEMIKFPETICNGCRFSELVINANLPGKLDSNDISKELSAILLMTSGMPWII